MSVINQTLRDLQKRGVQPDIAIQAQAAAPEVPVRRTLSGLGLKLLAAGLFLAVGFGAALLIKGVDEPSALMFAQGAGSNDAEQDSTQVSSVELKLEPIEKQQNIPASAPVAGVISNTAELIDKPQEQVYTMQVRVADAPPLAQGAAVSPAVQTISSSPKAKLKPELKSELKPEPEPEPEPAQAEVSVTISPETLDQQNASSARKLLTKGDYGVARQQLESFVDTSSVHQASLLELAKLLSKTKDGAALDALLLKQQSSANSDLIALAARRYLELGELSKAQRVLEQRLPAIEEYVHYYSLLAAVYQKQEQYLKQVDIYQRLIEAHGDRAKWWLGVAIAWDHLKQYEPARRAYIKAQQLKLNDAQLMVFAGQRLKQLKGY